MKAGAYRHFKGDEYGVLGVAEHSETGEKLVVYFSKKGKGIKWWVRPLGQFTEKVKHNGKMVPRFKYVAKQ